ncbi:unnamed protein product [Mesocestoides corti]|uniref:GAF domain-containing protein n=1 Tax=Mesocestoides corti TaxID=53468 RepID=A0A0R3UFS8_MESCO|nr:unnamed protein product [Mesocestoides corti]
MDGCEMGPDFLSYSAAQTQWMEAVSGVRAVRCVPIDPHARLLRLNSEHAHDCLLGASRSVFAGTVILDGMVSVIGLLHARPHSAAPPWPGARTGGAHAISTGVAGCSHDPTEDLTRVMPQPPPPPPPMSLKHSNHTKRNQ